MTTQYSPAQQWADAIQSFESAQLAAKYSPLTVEKRVKQVRRLAAADERGPWRQDFESLARHLLTLPEGFTRDDNRSSIRSFYRWALAAGRVFDDPSVTPEYVSRRAHLPEPWRQPLADFRTFQRSIGRNESTIAARSSQLSRFAREHASLGPWEVEYENIVAWLGGKRWAAEMRRAHRGALRIFYAWAVDTERTSANPAERIPVVRRGIHMPRPVIDDDYQLALAKADPRERLALRLAAELGLRAGETVKVHARDLIPRGEGWSLLVHGKGDKERMIPLTDSMLGLLRAQGPGYAFPGQINGHMSSHYMSKIISRLLPEGVTMHALRHRFATRAYAVNRDVFAVQQLLGHASPATTQAYVQVPDFDLRHLMETVSA